MLASVPYQWSHCLEHGNVWGFLMSLVGETHTVLLKGVSVGKTWACLEEHESHPGRKNRNILIRLPPRTLCDLKHIIWAPPTSVSPPAKSKSWMSEWF